MVVLSGHVSVQTDGLALQPLRYRYFVKKIANYNQCFKKCNYINVRVNCQTNNVIIITLDGFPISDLGRFKSLLAVPRGVASRP